MAASNNPFYVDPGGGALAALLQGVQGFDSGQQYAARSAAQDALERGDNQSALARLIGAGDTKSAVALSQYMQNANGVFGTPIYGTVNGKPAIGTFDKQGRFRPIDTGSFAVSEGIKPIDTGLGTLLVGGKSGAPIQGQPGQPWQAAASVAGNGQPGQSSGPVTAPPAPVNGYIPKDVSGESRAKKIGEDQADLMKNKTKNEQLLVQLENQWKLVDDSINDLLKKTDLTKAGLIGSAMSAIPGTPAYDFARVLETIKANIGFDKLQSMRDNSPTGGALGQVSDFENRLLQSVRGALEQGQSPGQLRANLMRIQQDLRALQGEKRKAFEQTYGNVRPVSSGATDFAAAPVTKSIGGKTYMQINGQWYEQ
jgi:hypothetical protein